MSVKVSRAWVPFMTLSTTPCTSDLWVMSGESILSATGKPSCIAIIIASGALRARMVSVTGMWKDASSVLDSISVSTLRRSVSTLSMTRRAPSMSGSALVEAGGGVCCSSSWFCAKLAMLPKAPTAASGVRKVGMAALLSTARPSPTEASPIQQVSRGLPMVRWTSASTLATSAASTPILGEKMTSTPSIWRSLAAACKATR